MLTPNPSLPHYKRIFIEVVVQLLTSSSIHKNSATCYKYSKIRDNPTCQMRMPFAYGHQVYIRSVAAMRRRSSLRRGVRINLGDSLFAVTIRWRLNKGSQVCRYLCTWWASLITTPRTSLPTFISSVFRNIRRHLRVSLCKTTHVSFS